MLFPIRAFPVFDDLAMHARRDVDMERALPCAAIFIDVVTLNDRALNGIRCFSKKYCTPAILVIDAEYCVFSQHATLRYDRCDIGNRRIYPITLIDVQDFLDLSLLERECFQCRRDAERQALCGIAEKYIVTIVVNILGRQDKSASDLGL